MEAQGTHASFPEGSYQATEGHAIGGGGLISKSRSFMERAAPIGLQRRWRQAEKPSDPSVKPPARGID